MSPQQQEYVALHSPAQRAARLVAARRANELAVTQAHQLYCSGDAMAARDTLSSAGIPDDGVRYWLRSWSGHWQWRELDW